MIGKKATVARSKKLPKPIRIMLVFLSTIVVVAVLAFAGLRLIYPAIMRTSHKIEAPGIDRMEMVEIGGIQQVLYFRGENVDNPVILFLHGGPGSPMIPILHTFQYDWEGDYTVVQWDQRNAGKTYVMNDLNTVLETLSVDRMIEDAHEVTQYIKQTLGKEKIVVLGHSWGTALGSALVQKYPEDYSAYIGVGQVVGFKDNEIYGYQRVLDAAKEAGDEDDIAALEALNQYWEKPISEFQSDVNKMRQIQTKYKLADGASLGLLLDMFSSPYYTTGELLGSVSVNVMLYDQEKLYEEMLGKNLGSGSVSKDYSISVYYIMGENDYQTPYPLAKDFFEEIKAPNKDFFSVPNAGHMTMTGNKAEFDRIMLEEIRPKLQ